MPDKSVLKKSVTAANYPSGGDAAGPVMRLMLGGGLGAGDMMNGLQPYPPPYWSFQRDSVLRATIYYESMWASSIYTALSKVASMSWYVQGDVRLQVKQAQQLLLQAGDNQSWSTFIYKHLRDFLLTDNGAFLEVIHASGAAGSKVLGMIHLDAMRCQRTGDPEIPVIYRDRSGVEHEMRAHQVIAMSDMPDPGELWYGVGLCAASRAYKAIYKLAAIENYVSEKASGRRPLAIHFVNNVTQNQINTALRDADDQANAKGISSYMGAVAVGLIDPAAPAGVATIDLAGLPDGFDADLERKKSYLAYANAIGLDPQDIDPELLGSKSTGTGAQSRVIDDKASGKGIVAYPKMLMHQLSQSVLPQRVMFYFAEGDLRDQIQKANLEKARTDVQAARVTAGLITAAQGTQLLADAGDIPQQFLPVDMTPLVTLSDTDRSDEQLPPVSEEVETAIGIQHQKLFPELFESEEPVDEMDNSLPVDEMGNPLPPQVDENGQPLPPQVDENEQPLQESIPVEEPVVIDPSQRKTGSGRPVPVEPPAPPEEVELPKKKKKVAPALIALKEKLVRYARRL